MYSKLGDVVNASLYTFVYTLRSFGNSCQYNLYQQSLIFIIRQVFGICGMCCDKTI